MKCSAESRTFSMGTPVSSRRGSLLDGRVIKGNTGLDRHTVIGKCCCGDPVFIAKLNKKNSGIFRFVLRWNCVYSLIRSTSYFFS